MEENTVVLVGDPLEGWAPDEVRQWLVAHQDTGSLASAMAAISNKVGSLLHELDDSENPCSEETFEQWVKLKDEVLDEIVARCFTVQEWAELSRKGTHWAIESFMNRYGYVDGSGWWISAGV